MRCKHRGQLNQASALSYRFRMEPLEPRICPAVTFGLSSGVLTVTGDEADNIVEIADFGEGRVSIVGDGQTQSFMDVEEIFIETGEGDDQVSYTKVRNFTVTFQGPLHIDVGDGDDQIQISDGAAGGRIRNELMSLSMDLGAGHDQASVDIHHDDQLDLDIRSSDGGDSMFIGGLLPAVQKIRPAAARVSAHLGEGGNLVSIQTRNFDAVDVAIETIASADRAGEALPPDSFSLNFANTIDPSGQQRHFHGFPGRLSVGGKFGDADDRLTIDSQGFEEVVDQLALGGGNDTAQVRHRMFAVVDHTNIDLTADLGDGDDAVTVLLRRLANPGVPPSADLSSADVTIRMGAGDDNVSMMTHGYRRIVTDLDTGPAGDGHDIYVGKYLLPRPRPLDRSSTALDGGNDLSEIVAMGYGSVDVQTEQTRQVTLIQDL